MPKEILIGAKPLLKKAEYTWWPPKQFAKMTIGQFDVYPPTWNSKALNKLLESTVSQQLQQPKPAKVEELSKGCIVVKDFQSMHEQ